SGVALEILTDGFIGFLQETLRGGGFDLIEMPLDGDGLPVLEIAATVGAIERDLIRAQDKAGMGVSRVADPRHVAPGIGGIAGMDADAVSVHAARRFAG